MKRLLTVVALCLAALTLRASPFSDLSFDAALKMAADAHKLVLVDFYTTWCGPCRLLDRTTWTNNDVIRLVQEKTIAIRIDAEKKTKLASRYHIEAYPTILVVKPDGTEMDRLIGYRDAAKFTADFNAVLKGRSAAVRAAETAELSDTNSPHVRMNHAFVLTNDTEALKEFSWCYDHGPEVDPSFRSLRLAVISGIEQLAARNHTAREALISRRNAGLANFDAAPGDEKTATEIVFLNNALGQPEKNLALFDRFSAGSAAQDGIRVLILDQLIKAKRYSDVLGGSYANAPAAFAQRIVMYNDMVSSLGKSKVRDDFVRGYRSQAVQFGANLFEALAALKKNDAARQLAGDVLKFDASPETHQILADAATRSSNPELSQFVKQ